jgi:hypothetical protein
MNGTFIRIEENNALNVAQIGKNAKNDVEEEDPCKDLKVKPVSNHYWIYLDTIVLLLTNQYFWEYTKELN